MFVAVSLFANGNSEKKAGDIEQTEKKPKVTEKKAGTGQTKSQATVQVLLPISENLSTTESAWLPGQIQDKLKANMQEYLGGRTVVDSNAEKSLKRLQAESESGARDANTAIELGKITTAKYGLFSKIRKTGYGYSLSVDYTDLTTGEQIASATSKEYSKAEYLYGSTGAVDEVTLALANKLDITLNDLTRNLLSSGSADFSVDAQMALAKQNEEHYQKLMQQYDEDLRKLSVSNDINAVENKKKIEAEKALLTEKQKTEQKRLAELKAQKQQAEADKKLEAERSIELKTQRDNLAKEAAAKAAEVRKLKLDKQGVLGQITVIESKKKALVEIRQAIENHHIELYKQMEEDKKTEEDKIRNAPWSTVELNNGQPTEAAKQRRENKIIASNDRLQNKFFDDCDAVQRTASQQDLALLTEIQTDQKALEKNRTVSSMSDELKVNYGLYDGSRDGWVAYINLYSEGVLLFSDSFLLKYEALSGKKAPNMATELNDAVINEYANIVDMYNSLLTRGDPILYYELDYTVKAENDDSPSQYAFAFDRIRAVNTISGKIVQTTTLAKKQDRTMTPAQDLRVYAGIVEKEKAQYDQVKYKEESYMVKYNFTREAAIELIKIETEAAAKFQKQLIALGIQMVPIPNTDFEMMTTEVTQKVYKTVMGKIPSYSYSHYTSLYREDDNLPVEVNWFDAVRFCNTLNQKLGLTSDNGFRLPWGREWKEAAKGGEVYKFSENNNINAVTLTPYNRRKHPVAQKKPNGYGLYDMGGNVGEWCQDKLGGSSWDSRSDDYLVCGYKDDYWLDDDMNAEGFRIVRNIK